MALAAVAYAKAMDRRQVMVGDDVGRAGCPEHGDRGGARRWRTGCRCCCCRVTPSPAGRRTRCSSRSSTSAIPRRRERRVPGGVAVLRPDHPAGAADVDAAAGGAGAHRPGRLPARWCWPCRRTCRPRSSTSRRRCSRRACTASRGRGPTRARSPRRRRSLRGGAAAAAGRWAAVRGTRGRARRGRVRGGATGSRSSTRRPAGPCCRTPTRCTAARSGSSAATSANALAARGGRRARRRLPAPGLRDGLLDGVLARGPARAAERGPLRRRQARGRRRVVGDARAELEELDARLDGCGVDATWSARAAREGARWDAARRPAAGGRRPGRVADLRAGRRRGQRRVGAGRLRAHLVGRHAGGAPRRLAGRGAPAAGATSGATMDLEYGFSCMGYEMSGAWGAAMAHAARPIPMGSSPRCWATART